MEEYYPMLWDALGMFLFLGFELSILFIVISFGVSLLQQYIPDSRIQSILGSRKGWGYIFAALLGAITPFCSCSTIPMLRGLLKAKAGFGPTMTFLFCSPLLNPIIIGLFLATFGVRVTVYYIAIALGVSIAAAFVLDALRFDRYVIPESGAPKTDCGCSANHGDEITGTSASGCCGAVTISPSPPVPLMACCAPMAASAPSQVNSCCTPAPKTGTGCCGSDEPAPGKDCCTEGPAKEAPNDCGTGNEDCRVKPRCNPPPSCCPVQPTVATEGCCEPTLDSQTNDHTPRFRYRCRTAFGEALALFKSVSPYLLLGIALGAFVYGFVPSDFIVKYASGDSLFAIPVAAMIGIPLYVRTEVLIPLSAVLAEKGMGLGAIMALIIGGGGASITEVILLKSMFRMPMICAFLLVILGMAVSAGYLFQYVL